MFTIERELTDREIEQLQVVATHALAMPEAQEAIAEFNIIVAGRSAASVIEEIVRSDVSKKYETLQKWPSYVRFYLRTESWQLGYGYVGTTEAK